MGRSVKITTEIMDKVAKIAGTKKGEGVIGLTQACLQAKQNYGSLLARAKVTNYKPILNLVAKYTARDLSKAKKAVKAKPAVKKTAKPKIAKSPKVKAPKAPVIPATVPATDQTLQVSEAAIVDTTKVLTPA